MGREGLVVVGVMRRFSWESWEREEQQESVLFASCCRCLHVMCRQFKVASFPH